MSKLNDDDPDYWHDADGRHRVTDPRKHRDRNGVDTHPQKFWDADDRRYVEHLKEHERQASDPQPQEGDSPRVVGLFALIKHRESEIEVMKSLIVALRQQESENKTEEET